MGLIMGGYFSEPWETPRDPEGRSLNGQTGCGEGSPIQERLNSIADRLQALFYDDHSQRRADVSSKLPPAATTLNGEGGLHAALDVCDGIPLLFHLERLVRATTAAEERDNVVSPYPVNPEPQDVKHVTSSYHFFVDENTKAWAFSVNPTSSTFETRSSSANVVTTVSIVQAGAASLVDILRDYIAPKVPVLLRHGASHWPALTSWRNVSSRLLACGPLRLIPVEIGSSYTTHEWSQKIMTIQDYVDQYLVKSQECKDIGYIAQHPMLDHMPQLQDELVISDIVAAASEIGEIIRLLWIGPQGTVSPYHTDSHDNLYTQVSGFKYIQLISPNQENMYTYHTMLTNTSSVTPADVLQSPVDRRQYPQFPTNHLECIVGPGDQLYIPKGWWHFVKSLTPSVSLSTWFDPSVDGPLQ